MNSSLAKPYGETICQNHRQNLRHLARFTNTRGFSEDEAAYFEEGAQKAYKSFTTKAAASRNMTIDDMLTVAQGRVWTGRQALDRNLVDRVGGLWEAVTLCYNMTDLRDQKTANQSIRIQYMREPKSGFIDTKKYY